MMHDFLNDIPDDTVRISSSGRKEAGDQNPVISALTARFKTYSINVYSYNADWTIYQEDSTRVRFGVLIKSIN
jgi:hypothetical protein